MADIAGAESGSFTVTVRPARAVYLIAQGSREGFRHAVQQASTRWGGAREPIVEVSADGRLAERVGLLVEFANLDAAVNVDVAPGAAARVVRDLVEGEGRNPETFKLVSIEDIDRYGTAWYTAHPADLADGPLMVAGGNGYVIAGNGAPLWHAAAAGDLSAVQEARFGPGSLQFRRARQDPEIAEAQLWGHTLLERTLVSFGERTIWRERTTQPAVLWLTRGDELADCVGFWNLRAVSPVLIASMPIHLMPADISTWTSSFPRTVRSSLLREDRPAPDIVLTSATLDPDVLTGFADALGLKRVESGARRGTQTGPLTYAIDNPLHRALFRRAYGEIADAEVPVLRERIVLRVPNPVPLAVGATGRALVGVSGDRLALLPRRACTAELVSRGAVWRDSELQLQEFLEPTLRLELNLPTPEAACRAVLSERTKRHKVSEKGSIGLALMSPATLAAVRAPHVFEAIKSLTTERVVRELKAGFERNQALTAHQQELLSQLSGHLRRAFRTPAKMGFDEAAALSALEHLAGVGWAERGFATKCADCGLASFVPLSSETALGAAGCPVCASAAEYIRNRHGPAVHYRLDARVDRANAQGMIAHLMVIGTLIERHGPAYLMPGVDLTFPDGLNRETDLFGVCDGRLVSGEVKMSGDSFDEEEIDKDVDIAARLGVDVHIMAAATAISEKATQFAEARCLSRGIDLLVLEAGELRA